MKSLLGALPCGSADISVPAGSLAGSLRHAFLERIENSIGVRARVVLHDGLRLGHVSVRVDDGVSEDDVADLWIAVEVLSACCQALGAAEAAVENEDSGADLAVVLDLNDAFGDGGGMTAALSGVFSIGSISVSIVVFIIFVTREAVVALNQASLFQEGDVTSQLVNPISI